MAATRANRRLAAILAADIAGYSRLVSEDEEATLAALTAHRAQLVDIKINEFGGRIANTAGDSILAEFPSVIEALRCAIELQSGMEQRNVDIAEGRRIEFRIGLHVGDVVEQDGDLLGDGVNIAARLEGLAEPGGIYISRPARDQVRDRMDIALEDMGEVEVKNIVRPVRVFRVQSLAGTPRKAAAKPTGSRRNPVGQRRLRAVATIAVVLLAAAAGLLWLKPWGSDVEAASIDRMAFPLPGKPSIAVLPFADQSAEGDQEYFADGITEDIITDLSKVSGLFVVARDSMSDYRNKPVKIRQVAEDLGVRYVLEGSVRRSGQKIRVTAQIIDALKGVYLWGEKYDREVDDVFAVQSEITEQVVKAMSVTLKANEHDRVFQKYITNIDAYDTFIRARSTVDNPIRANIEKGEELFKRTIELDPGFAGGYAGLSFNYSVKARFHYGEDPEEDARRSLELAQKAIAVDDNFPWSYIALAGAYLANGKHDNAVDAARHAVAIQPNGYEANLFMGFYLNFAGQPDRAVEYLETANGLSRIDTIRGLSFLGMAYFTAGRYADCAAVYKRRFERFGGPDSPIGHVFLAAAQAKLGEVDEAARTAERFRRKYPKFHMSKWLWINNYKKQEDRIRLYSAAIAAGISE